MIFLAIQFGPIFHNPTSAYERAISKPEYKEGSLTNDIKTGKIFVYHNKEWVEVTAEEALERSGFSLYQFNQMLMNNFPVLEDLTGAKTTINNFHEDINSSKYLLLCKDISYYTFFETALFHEFDNLAEAVIECSNSVGDIVDCSSDSLVFYSQLILLIN